MSAEIPTSQLLQLIAEQRPAARSAGSPNRDVLFSTNPRNPFSAMPSSHEKCRAAQLAHATGSRDVAVGVEPAARASMACNIS